MNHSDLERVIDEHMKGFRDRQYSPSIVLQMFMYQALNQDSSCQSVVNKLNVERIRQGLEPYSSHTGGYCQARNRLSLEMLEALVKKSGKKLSSNSLNPWLWKGRRVKLADGTTILLPDSEDNQSHYPQHGQQSEGAGFPIIRLVAVLCLSTGGVLDFNVGAYRGKGTGEHSLFRELLDCFEEGDVLLADRYYASFFLVAELIKRGVDTVFEQHGARNTDFRKGKKLGTRDHIVFWKKPQRPTWMSQEEYAGYPDTIEVREVKVGKKVLVTTMKHKRFAPKKVLEELYFSRWHVELDLRNIKSVLGMEMLSCKTARMCRKELWIYMLAYNVIRILMSEAAAHSNSTPREISFKHTLQIWIASIEKLDAVLPVHTEGLNVYHLIAQIKVGNRPGRVEPRAVKRRPKPYPRLKTDRQTARGNIMKNGHEKKMAA